MQSKDKLMTNGYGLTLNFNFYKTYPYQINVMHLKIWHNNEYHTFDKATYAITFDLLYNIAII